jgi:PqqD family protein of HPr-rel-A system
MHQDATGAPWYDPRAELPCPLRRSDVTQQTLDDEAVLFDPQTGATYRLNRTALAVWRGCRPGVTVPGLGRMLQREFAIDAEPAQDDAEQLLALFAEHGLVVAPSDQAASAQGGGA